MREKASAATAPLQPDQFNRAGTGTRREKREDQHEPFECTTERCRLRMAVEDRLIIAIDMINAGLYPGDMTY